MWCIGRVHCCLIEGGSLVHAPGVSEGWSVWRRNRMVHAPGWMACAFCRVHSRRYARRLYIDPLAGPAHALCTRLACADPHNTKHTCLTYVRQPASIAARCRTMFRPTMRKTQRYNDLHSSHCLTQMAACMGLRYCSCAKSGGAAACGLVAVWAVLVGGNDTQYTHV
jgi:hypothetical protein